MGARKLIDWLASSLLVLLCLTQLGCAKESAEYAETSVSAKSATADQLYSYAAANADGIGKFYLGREISHIMGHQGASWLERPDRQAQEGTDLLLVNLPLAAGQNAADIGAGTGYFSLPMAQIVGEQGTVYAVDIQPEMLAIIEQRSAEQGIHNIELLLATEKAPGLPEGAINMALFVDAYHEFEWPFEVMSAIYTSLVPGGKVVLIEYRGEEDSIRIKRLHKMTARQVREEMTAVGFEYLDNLTVLPQQHFLIFQKPLTGR